MKKLSFRMRITVLTGLCLTVSSVIISLILFLMVDTQIVDIVQFGSTTEHFINKNELEFEIADGEEFIFESYIEEQNSILESSVNHFRTLGLISLFFVVVIGSGTAWFVAEISIKPLKELSRNISEIDEKNLSFRIKDFSADDELNELSDSFNKMIKRLDNAFAREKRFSAAAAHELKTPIAVMKSSIDVLELSDYPDIKEYEETISYLKKQTRRLDELTKQLLDLSHQNNNLRERVNLKILIREIVNKYSVNYPKNIFIVDNTNDCNIFCNVLMIRRAISNLLDNAIKYGGKDCKIGIKLLETQTECSISVWDNGQGISEEAFKHIFEPFYREDKSRNRQIGGAGLGLAIVKEIAEDHFGCISYENNIPTGSVFILTLPKAK